MEQMGISLESGQNTTLLSSELDFGRRLLGFTKSDWLFFCLFIFRYARFFVHTITGIFLYKPSPESPRPRYSGKDVAVIVPTVDPTTKEFYRCLESILKNSPRFLFIVTVGHLERAVEDRLSRGNTRSRYPATTICTHRCHAPNKRKQILLGLRSVDAKRKHRADVPILVFVDDQVSWGPRFLPSLLAAFEDPRVGLVGTNKKARASTTIIPTGDLRRKLTSLSWSGHPAKRPPDRRKLYKLLGLPLFVSA